MSVSDRIQFAALVVAIIAFATAELVRILQRRRLDARSNTKLRIFEILGGESRSLASIKSAYDLKFREISQDELRKSIYEMLVDGTAFYESTGEYRAHWRNPKPKNAVARRPKA